MRSEVTRHQVDLTNPGNSKADWFFFVQQGQMDTILKAWDYRMDLVRKNVYIYSL